MGKLSELVTEDVSVSDRMKINARRVRLAGIGLFSKVDAERVRLYKQITEMGESYGANDSILGRLSLVGTGTMNFVLEETQRMYDVLVEEGDRALAKDALPSKSAFPKTASAADKITTARPVAKPKVAVAKKPAAKPAPKKAKPAAPVLSDALKQRFEAAKKLAGESSDVSEQVGLDLLALEKQISEGDVKGRRPAQTKIQERAEFDARRELKGMKVEDALGRYESLVESLIPETAQ